MEEIDLIKSDDHIGLILSSGHDRHPSVQSLRADHSPLRRWNCCRLVSHKINFVVLCVTTYLGVSVTFSYNMYVSDFLGKVVMGGDSSAPQGSAELKAYEDGVGLAAGGLLILFSSYMIFGVVQNKLLKVLGMNVFIAVLMNVSNYSFGVRDLDTSLNCKTAAVCT